MSSLEQPSIPPTSTQLPDTKVLQDLSTVIEKINLCTTMLHPLNSTQQVDQDESLLTIIGFLEACVPRVRELIEAGMTGALKEDTVVKCLAVNDSLCQVLEFVEHPETCLPEAAAGGGGAAAAAGANHDKKTNQFDAFGIAEEDGEDDADDNFFALDTSNDSKLPAKKKKDDDPFAMEGSSTTVGSTNNILGDSKKKEESTMVGNAKKPSSALEDLLLTPSSDALPTPPPPRSTTGNVSVSGNGSSSGNNTLGVATNAANPSAKDAPGKDPIQDEFDKFFDD